MSNKTWSVYRDDFEENCFYLTHKEAVKFAEDLKDDYPDYKITLFNNIIKD